MCSALINKSQQLWLEYSRSRSQWELWWSLCSPYAVCVTHLFTLTLCIFPGQKEPQNFRAKPISSPELAVIPLWQAEQGQASKRGLKTFSARWASQRAALPGWVLSGHTKGFFRSAFTRYSGEQAMCPWVGLGRGAREGRIRMWTTCCQSVQQESDCTRSLGPRDAGRGEKRSAGQPVSRPRAPGYGAGENPCGGRSSAPRAPRPPRTRPRVSARPLAPGPRAGRGGGGAAGQGARGSQRRAPAPALARLHRAAWRARRRRSSPSWSPSLAGCWCPPRCPPTTGKCLPSTARSSPLPPIGPTCGRRALPTPPVSPTARTSPPCWRWTVCIPSAPFLAFAAPRAIGGGARSVPRPPPGPLGRAPPRPSPSPSPGLVRTQHPEAGDRDAHRGLGWVGDGGVGGGGKQLRGPGCGTSVSRGLLGHGVTQKGLLSFTQHCPKELASD